MSISIKVREKIKETIKEYDMINAGSSVLVALSGGADSICLTHALFALAKEMKFKVFAAHLNHGIRGEEALRDENFAKEFCKRLEIPFFSKKVYAVEIAKSESISVEEAGRNARYEFFAEIKKEQNIDVVATAHNKNDAAETVLMRIIRGTGTDGLAGIKFVREDGVIRPLLKVSREEIEAYCAENKLEFCTDSTNSDNDYTRNRIRNELLPYIRENFNPSVTESLLNLSESAARDSEFLNSYARRLYFRLGSPMPNRKPVVLHIESIKTVDAAIEARLILAAAKEAMGESFYLEKKHIRDILSLKEKETGASLTLPKGLSVSVKYGWLEFTNNSEDKTKSVPKYYQSDYMAVIEPPCGYKIEGRGGTVYVKRALMKEYKKSAGDILLDEDKLCGEVVLRNRRKGDKMAVFSDGRSKKIKSIFIDMKIPREARDDIPLICSGDEVLAIVGGRVSEKYKADKNSERVWVIYYGDDGQG